MLKHLYLSVHDVEYSHVWSVIWIHVDTKNHIKNNTTTITTTNTGNDGKIINTDATFNNDDDDAHHYGTGNEDDGSGDDEDGDQGDEIAFKWYDRNEIQAKEGFLFL